MVQLRENGPLTVLICRTASDGDGTEIRDEINDAPAHSWSDPAVREIVAALPADARVVIAGPRPKKRIDEYLMGRVLVVGDDADMNAVVLRLVRRELLGAVQLAYAAVRPSALTELYSIPVGARAVELARFGEVDLVPLVRSDAGGVLVGRGQLGPIAGTFYVDEHRIAGGSARWITVEPETSTGLTVTVVRRRFGPIGPRPRVYTGRAVEFGILPGSDTTITYDGIAHPRATNRWVFYQHTEPIRLVRGLF